MKIGIIDKIKLSRRLNVNYSIINSLKEDILSFLLKINGQTNPYDAADPDMIAYEQQRESQKSESYEENKVAGIKK